MPTLGDVAIRLHVSRRTLDKWIKRCGITPQQHPADWRYRTISEEDVEAIRSARAEMPGSGDLYARVPYGLPILPAARDVPELPLPALSAPRPRVPTRKLSTPTSSVVHDGPLPDGWIAWRLWCAAMNVPTRTFERRIKSGQMPVHRGIWQTETPGVYVREALDEAEQQLAAELFAAYLDRRSAAESGED